MAFPVKFLRVTMRDGSTWEIPAVVIAEHRARYYADKGDDFDEERAFALSSDHELLDWASNNMDWADVQEHAEQLKPCDPIDHDEAWVNARKVVIQTCAACGCVGTLDPGMNCGVDPIFSCLSCGAIMERNDDE